MLLQEFASNYNKRDTLHSRKVIKNALIDVIEKGQRSATEWNVQFVLQTRGGQSQKFIKPCEKECRVFLIHL